MSNEVALHSLEPGAYNVAHGQLPSAPTKRITLVAFDDYLNFDASGNGTFFTSDSLDDLLGLFDQLAIEIVADQATASTVSLGAQIYHSGDGRTYFKKASSPEVPVTAIPAATTTLLPIGYDDGSIPSLGFVRVRLLAGGRLTLNSVHVKMTLTANSTQEHKFSAGVEGFVEKTFFGGRCDHWYPAGTKIHGLVDPAGGFRLPPPMYFHIHDTAKNADGYTTYHASLRRPYRMCVQHDGRVVIAHGNVYLWSVAPWALVDFENPDLSKVDHGHLPDASMLKVDEHQ
jgi:hypothetical protein